jgi:hypothetical protein
MQTKSRGIWKVSLEADFIAEARTIWSAKLASRNPGGSKLPHSMFSAFA